MPSTSPSSSIPALSILDLQPIPSGSDAAATLKDSLELAQLAEQLNFGRYWVAEHHNAAGIASSVPLAMLAAASQVTSSIRLGAGGVMLPNHSPLSVAEGYKLLSALAPGRVDLGLGRAPGTDGRTARALRGAAGLTEQPFEGQLAELMAFGKGQFPAGHPYAGIVASPSDPQLFPPLWILSSSGYGAQVAGYVGAGLAFALHINPDRATARAAAELYRATFRPSPDFAKPRVMVAVSVICAPTQAEAEALATSLGLMFVRLRQGQLGHFPSVQEATDYPYTPQERAAAQATISGAIVGDPAQVRQQLLQLAQDTGADELMLSTMIHDTHQRRESYRLVKDAMQEEAM